MTQIETIRQKLRQELKDFEEKCIEKGAVYALRNAYEYVVKCELVYRYDDCMNDEDIQEALDGYYDAEYVYKYILKNDNALDYMYNCWIDSDANIGEMLTDTVEHALERVMGD